MELREALDILIAIPENMNHPAIQEAIETVKLHKQELENPSPVLVEIQKSIKNNYFRAVTNVPAQVVYVFGHMVPEHIPTRCDPSHVFLDPKDF